MTTVGFIYPGHAAEDDYPLAEKLLGNDVKLAVEHIYGEDLHAVAQLKDLGSTDRLAHGARLLAQHAPDAVIWACTSGSFVFGPDGAAAQVDALSAAAGVPASSTSFAFVRAAQALDLRRVAVSASYPADVSALFGEFLAAAGIEVLNLTAGGIDTAAQVGELSETAVVDLIVSNDHPDAQAVLVPDTAMRTFGVVNRVEAQLGKPVLTANQVTIWEGLRLADAERTSDAAGALFRSRRPGRHAAQA